MKSASLSFQLVRSARLLFVFWLWLAFSGSLWTLHADPTDPPVSKSTTSKPEDIEFFEAKVRPLLVKHCFECHGGETKTVKGSFRMDSRAAILKGGDSGVAVVPGKPDESALIQAVKWTGLEMPPSGRLSDEKIAILVKWVEIGAPWPDSAEASKIGAGTNYDWEKLRSEHWAWKPIVRPELPVVRDSSWCRNDIDRFVLAKLDSGNLSPNPPASPRVLLRRISLDLHGILPSVEEITQFEAAAAQNREAAVRDLVQRLLDSPRYGERWGRHWLDVARYSDGYGGFLDGAALPNAWRYRDWVINALNQDLPFDQFIKLQLAGDLIEPRENGIATGFLTLGPTYISDGGDPDATAQAKSETLDDRVDTVARGLMGLTAACARCHDHRFDPIPQSDYYSLAGVFNNTATRELPLVETSVVAEYDKYLQDQTVLRQKIEERSSLAKKEKRELTAVETQELQSWQGQLESLVAKKLEKYPFAHAIADTGAGDMAIAIRGNLRRPGEVVPRRFFQLLAGPSPTRFSRGSGRLDLADAIVSPANPLTTRVLVNRIWLHHFGQALVRTPSNFGVLGEKPTHPELLDWLASKLMGQGDSEFKWSLKRLHREIVLSATYQMDTAMNEAAFQIDGDNRLLWRMNPRRLDVEAWRDSILSATGELDLTLGGPSIENIANSPRRTVYAAVSRNGDRFASDAFLRQFDFPSARATSEGRTSSIVPQQSLFLMNSSFVIARARALARRLEHESPQDEARIRRAYQLLYSRDVTADELKLGREFLQRPIVPASQLTPWEQYCQVLLSASELMFCE